MALRRVVAPTQRAQWTCGLQIAPLPHRQESSRVHLLGRARAIYIRSRICTYEFALHFCVTSSSSPEAECFLGGTLAQVCHKEARESVRNTILGCPIADAMRDRAGRSDTSADEKIESLHLSTVDIEQHTLESYVGDPMLAARVRAAGEMDFDILTKLGNAVLELAGELDAQKFRLGNCELAEFTARARQRPTLERRATERHADIFRCSG